MLALGLVVALAGCAAPNDTATRNDGIYDPYEKTNRQIHALNKGLDHTIVRPVAIVYSAVVPDEIEDSVNNFSENLGMPGVAVNGVLQGDMRTAGLATSRFLINSVLGFGGLFDVATDFRIDEADTDFGETLHVWGVPEGAYVELPVFGPSTSRDRAGRIVDLIINPMNLVTATPERYYDTGTAVLSGLSDRGRYGDTVDQILYESADSYAQARLIYLQSRRFELGMTGASSTGSDPYADPYEDPYAE